jgi:predicted amidophosphoribosyltransferase
MYAFAGPRVAMLSVSDQRSFSSVEDRYQHCLFCGKALVLLPNDRRDGACFDCLSLLGPEAQPCPECGAEIAPPQRSIGCPSCNWSPLRD